MSRGRKPTSNEPTEQSRTEQPTTNAPLALDPGETVSLTIAEATDVVEPEKPSRLKRAIKNVFTTDEEEDKKPRRKRSTFFVKHTPLVIGGMLFCIHLLCPEEYKEVFFVNEKQYQYLPTEEQLSEILTPIARIADRHTHIADINPDVLDIIASGQACVAYGMELRATLILKAHIDKKAREEEKARQTEVWRNRLNGLNNTEFNA